ncbi:MAG: hypothetical protein QOG34_1933 [Frankiaceae bacterium]|nr:hypothetical protein [Frankiaceae bacterium]
MKRRLSVIFWRIVNPPTRLLAGSVPWWVLLETTGRRTGAVRRTPLAAGLRTPDGMWVNAVHGRHSAWVLNIDADPAVRLKVRGRWVDAVASVHPFDADIVSKMNRYARGGPSMMGLDPLLVFIEFGRVTSPYLLLHKDDPVE